MGCIVFIFFNTFEHYFLIYLPPENISYCTRLRKCIRFVKNSYSNSRSYTVPTCARTPCVSHLNLSVSGLVFHQKLKPFLITIKLRIIKRTGFLKQFICFFALDKIQIHNQLYNIVRYKYTQAGLKVSTKRNLRETLHCCAVRTLITNPKLKN